MYVRRVARTYLDDEKMTIVIVGDRRTIEEQVRPFGAVHP